MTGQTNARNRGRGFLFVGFQNWSFFCFSMLSWQRSNHHTLWFSTLQSWVRQYKTYTHGFGQFFPLFLPRSSPTGWGVSKQPSSSGLHWSMIYGRWLWWGHSKVLHRSGLGCINWVVGLEDDPWPPRQMLCGPRYWFSLRALLYSAPFISFNRPEKTCLMLAFWVLFGELLAGFHPGGGFPPSWRPDWPGASEMVLLLAGFSIYAKNLWNCYSDHLVLDQGPACQVAVSVGLDGSVLLYPFINW